MPLIKKIIPLLLLIPLRTAFGQTVKLSSGPTEVQLSNQFVQAVIDKKTATIISLKYQGLEMMGQRHDHWNVVGNSSGTELKKLPGKINYSVRIDPAKNQGERAEISFSYTYQGEKGTIPFNVDLRFALGTNDQGIYLSGLWKHPEGYPDFQLGQGRMIAVLNPQVFDFYTVDKDRRLQMATAADVSRGQKRNVKEAVLLTTGIRKGQVEHKYDYSAILAQTPAWGWTSTEHKVGCWMINPSSEIYQRGPHAGWQYGPC